VVWIFASGVVMWTLVLERYWYFSRILPREAEKILAEWNARTDRNSWLARHVRRAMISRLNVGMTTNFPLLKVMVPLAPLLGLIGTVSGMLEVFDSMALRGSADARSMASGVSHAMICTMTGLVILMTGVWSERIPTDYEFSGDVAWVVLDEAGVPSLQTIAPEKVVVVEGAQSPTEVKAGWHEAEIDLLYVDSARTRLFSGEILPNQKKFVATDGTEYEKLYTHAYESGAPLTKLAFERGLPGKWGGFIVLFSVLLFGISTAISWSYYGDRCAHYIWGAKAILPYKVLFVTMHFVGAVLSLDTVWALGDVALGLVTFPNLVALVLLSGLVKKLTGSYFERKPWVQNAEDHKRWVSEHKKK